jgi:hypothetical protein
LTPGGRTLFVVTTVSEPIRKRTWHFVCALADRESW